MPAEAVTGLRNGRNLDDAIALALDLTSYVSDTRHIGRHFSCTHPLDPRDALEQFILAWEKEDVSSFAASLGVDDTFAAIVLRSQVRPKTGGHLAVGYKLDTPSRWSEPEHTLNEHPSLELPISPETFPLQTTFTDSSGKNCGTRTIMFSKKGKAEGFTLGDSQLKSLLRLLASCAVEN